MSDAQAWLDARRPAAPESLARAVTAALEGAPAGAASIPDRLADAGLAALERVLAAPSTREHALELLAADALITHACEAAAEEGGDAVRRLTDRLDVARFDRLLDEHVPA